MGDFIFELAHTVYKKNHILPNESVNVSPGQYVTVVGSIDEYYERLWLDIKGEEYIFAFGATFGYFDLLGWLHENAATGGPKVKGIFDNDSKKWGSEYHGSIIYGPSSFFKDGNYKGEYILITCGAADEIVPQLLRIGAPEDRIKIFTVGFYDDLKSFYGFYHSHEKDFKTVFDQLSDQKSKDVFLNLVNFKLSGNIDLLKQCADPVDSQYFDEKLVKYDSEDIVVDCGAYNGDTIEKYTRYSKGVFKEYYAIEADPINFAVMKKKVEGNKRIVCVNKGVWNSHDTLRFSNSCSGKSSSIVKEGDIVVQMDTIDSIVGDSKVSHIKMDIEGAEVPALIGAYGTISKNKPTLAICVYHRNDDFIRIPLLIKSICPEYELYFRHYKSMSTIETVCYALVR